MVRRQEPVAELIRDYIRQGLLGEVYQISIRQIRRRGIPGLGGWFTTQAQSGGGALIDIAVHSFDLALWATNYWNPTRVSAQTYAKFGSPIRDYKYVNMWAGPPKLDGVFDVDDFTAGFVRFENKATMSFEVAWAANAEDVNSIEFLGTKGGIRLGRGPQDILLRTEQNGMLTDVRPVFSTDGDPFVKELSKFVGAINGENEVPATGEQGVIDMRLLDAVYHSARLRQEVEV